MEEVVEQQISKHSSGVSIVIRIDGLWKDANNHSRAGQYSKWNSDIDAVWRELARDVKAADYDKKQKEFDAFDDDLVKTGVFKDHGSDTFNEPSMEDNEKRS